ncbi:Peptidase M12A [Trinorchestia longiramus]|nr:Peptidase M12A [Trinorchestia longiramus]
MKFILLSACLVVSAMASPYSLHKGNPDERDIQGDMRGPLPKRNKNGLIDEYYRWPGGVVPFEIGATISTAQEIAIRRAMADYSTLTNGCINFVDRNGESDYVRFIYLEEGCWSNVGRIGGQQNINYPTWCTDSYGSTMHEMLHTLGFFHEQSSSNRDDYVTIEWDNIEEGAEHNFDKYDDTYITDFGYPYDYNSVMHYGAFAFSANGLRTIVTTDPDYAFVIGQRDGLSQIDLDKLLAMYNC